jgi:hypothetical protein
MAAELYLALYMGQHESRGCEQSQGVAISVSGNQSGYEGGAQYNREVVDLSVVRQVTTDH